MKRIIATTVFLILFANISFAQSQNTSNIPVKIKFIRQQGGKPPLKFNFVNLSITNNTDSLRWYVFPWYINDSLKSDGHFRTYAPWETGQMGGRKYPDSTTSYQIVDIDFVGIDAFIAFCIPPKSSMTFENYMFESDGDTVFRSIELWEAKNLMVNGKTPLDKWLPYDVKCTPNAHLKSKDGSGWDWYNLDWDPTTNKSRTDYPKDTVTIIQAVGVKKFDVKFD